MEAAQNKILPLAGLALLATAGLVLGYSLDQISLKPLLILLVAILGGVVLTLPYATAIKIVFLYLGIEGMAKLLTNYNPIVHVSADILVGALCARWFFNYLLRRQRWPARYPPLFKLIMAHFVWFVICFMNPYSLSLFASLAGAKVYVTMVMLYLFGYYLTDSARTAQSFMAPWIVVLALQAATSIYQAVVGPSSVANLGPAYASAMAKFYGYAFRPFGTSALPGAPAVYIALAMPLLVYLILWSRSRAPRFSAPALIPGALVAVTLCQVRSALMKILISVTSFLLLSLRSSSPQARKRGAVLLVLAGVAFAVALPRVTGGWVAADSDHARAVDRTLSLFDLNVVTTARAGAWDRIKRFATEMPLGAGLSRTGAAAGKFVAEIASDPYFPELFFTDNFWAATIIDLGIPGSFILTCIIFAVLGSALFHRLRMRDRELLATNAVLISSLSSIVVGLWGAEGLLYNPEAAFFWFFSGVLMKLPELEPNKFPVQQKETAAGNLSPTALPATTP